MNKFDLNISNIDPKIKEIIKLNNIKLSLLKESNSNVFSK